MSHWLIRNTVLFALVAILGVVSRNDGYHWVPSLAFLFSLSFFLLSMIHED